MLSFEIAVFALMLAFNRHAFEGPINVTPNGHDDAAGVYLFTCDGCGETAVAVSDADAQDFMDQAEEQSQALFACSGAELGNCIIDGLAENAENVILIVAPYLEDRRAQGMTDNTFVLQTIKDTLVPWIGESSENAFLAKTYLGDAGFEQLGVVQ